MENDNAWNCPRCTFLNHIEIPECECCNFNLSDETPSELPISRGESLSRTASSSSSSSSSSCCICNDPCDTVHSAVCSKLHKTCSDCLQGLVLASFEPENLRRDRGGVSCPWRGAVIGPGQIARCESNKFELEALRPLLSAETHAICTTKMRDFVAALMNAEANEQHADNDLSSISANRSLGSIPSSRRTSSSSSTSNSETVSRQDRIQRYRLRLAEALNLRCPRCAAVFFDYDGCDALKCQSCATAFCAICLKDCGADAHPHVQQQHGRMHSSRDQFEAAHVERRAKIIAGALLIMDEPDDVKIDVLLALETEMQPMQITRAAVLDFIPGGLGAAGDAVRERNAFGGLWGNIAGGGGGGHVRRDEDLRAGFHDAEPSDPNALVAGALLVGGIALVSAFLSDRPPPPIVFEPLQRAVPNFLSKIFDNVYKNMCTVNDVLSTTSTTTTNTTTGISSEDASNTASGGGSGGGGGGGSGGTSIGSTTTSSTSSSSTTTTSSAAAAAGAPSPAVNAQFTTSSPTMSAWRCSICTLINSSDTVACVACNHPRGSSRHLS